MTMFRRLLNCLVFISFVMLARKCVKKTGSTKLCYLFTLNIWVATKRGREALMQHSDSKDRKIVRFHHTLPLMTKQRCSSPAVTSRLHQKFGISDTSVATSDILTWHQMWCSQINVWCLMFWQQIWCWLGYCFFHISSHFRTKLS